MNARLRSPLKNALGLGSARAGSHHFVVQRLTAAALVLLGLWFVWIVLELLHLDYAGAHALVARPCNAVLLLAFVTAVFWHAQLGLQVVIEDYVHTRGSQLLLQVAVKFLCFIGAAASVLAILKIALGR
ncbi:succinate dehydrogenase, hydrophobic membrane anchor protein [Dokdonella fugitiva]|jgi:succinate dehydrogenase / fumarate reductase membrane anchor subunit|uniref:succinate dehydrogenase, hydrophobic membrane anchor protein n=1 Tax=Dokdonella fugitiva TaxID=328517 RepID=UPI0015FCB230|nr:succinate dehydrogenase, hydrophobic membrane anchor protein [Dokdonella fugitiva]MBA8885278.1 succinate dehydrogenase / fumarate reductase membrane anchor subunit [Dokdonella fugitiva]